MLTDEDIQKMSIDEVIDHAIANAPREISQEDKRQIEEHSLIPPHTTRWHDVPGRQYGVTIQTKAYRLKKK